MDHHQITEAAIVQRAQDAGLRFVAIKVADGSSAYNADLAPAVTQALQAADIQVWGWHFLYGDSPEAEADVSIARICELNLDGLVIDAEPGARLGIGFSDAIAVEGMRAAALDGSIEHLLQWHAVQAGDFYYIFKRNMYKIWEFGETIINRQENLILKYLHG